MLQASRRNLVILPITESAFPDSLSFSIAMSAASKLNAEILRLCSLSFSAALVSLVAIGEESIILDSPVTHRELRKARLGSICNSRAGTIRDVQAKHGGDTQADDAALAAKINKPLSTYDTVVNLSKINPLGEINLRVGKIFSSSVSLQYSWSS